MFRKLNILLNIIIVIFIGAFIGYGIFKYWDYKVHPDLYAVTSFPWYTSLQLYGMLLVAILIIAAIIKILILRRIK